MLGREEFVHRMEQLIQQCQVPPIRDALIAVDKHACNHNHTTATATAAASSNTNTTTTSGNNAVVPVYSNKQQATTVLAPALSRSAYEVTPLREQPRICTLSGLI